MPGTAALMDWNDDTTVRVTANYLPYQFDRIAPAISAKVMLQYWTTFTEGRVFIVKVFVTSPLQMCNKF